MATIVMGRRGGMVGTVFGEDEGHGDSKLGRKHVNMMGSHDGRHGGVSGCLSS